MGHAVKKKAHARTHTVFSLFMVTGIIPNPTRRLYFLK